MLLVVVVAKNLSSEDETGISFLVEDILNAL